VVTLRDMDPGAVPAQVRRIMDDYVISRVEAGEALESARAVAATQEDLLFPGGQPAEGQHLMDVLDGDEVVGLLWMGRPMGGAESTWFVFFVEVDPARRGRGYGRATMEAAEAWTLERGGSRISLNVFGPNAAARSLYDSMGFAVMATQMYKDL
jgi:ribosomal protein S18 acetylase RimI-like enzyme